MTSVGRSVSRYSRLSSWLRSLVTKVTAISFVFFLFFGQQIPKISWVCCKIFVKLDQFHLPFQYTCTSRFSLLGFIIPHFHDFILPFWYNTMEYNHKENDVIWRIFFYTTWLRNCKASWSMVASKKSISLLNKSWSCKSAAIAKAIACSFLPIRFLVVSSWPKRLLKIQPNLLLLSWFEKVFAGCPDWVDWASGKRPYRGNYSFQ